MPENVLMIIMGTQFNFSLIRPQNMYLQTVIWLLFYFRNNCFFLNDCPLSLCFHMTYFPVGYSFLLSNSNFMSLLLVWGWYSKHAHLYNTEPVSFMELKTAGHLHGVYTFYIIIWTDQRGTCGTFRHLGINFEADPVMCFPDIDHFPFFHDVTQGRSVFEMFA